MISPNIPTAPTAPAPVAPALADTAAWQPHPNAIRQAMPQVAAAVDQLREVFGPVRVIFASEGGKELGQESPPGVIAHPPHVPNKSGKRGQS